MMKQFPSLLAVVGAWLCAMGLVLPGIVAFLFSSLWAIFVHKDTGVYTYLFLAANVVAFIRLTN